MYLRSRPRTSRRRWPSIGRILFWIIAPTIIVGGLLIYENRETLTPVVQEAVNAMIDDAGEAIATAQAPPPTATPDPTNNIRLAAAAWETGAIQEAVRLYETVIAALPNDLETHYRYTLGLIMQGRRDDSLRAADNTVTANPFASDAWAIRSLAYSRADEYGEAIASGLRALELNPDSARAMAFLAETYIEIDRPQRAESLISRAMETTPDSFEAYYARGMYNWLETFDFPAAMGDLEIAYDQSGGMPYIGVDLALLYIREEQIDTGLQLMQDMLTRNPESVPLLYQLGRYYGRNLGDDSRAIDFLTRCVATEAQNTLCHYELGRAYWDLENFEQARLAFENAINAGSENTFHLYWAGRAQIASLGNCALATPYFQRGYPIAVETFEDTQDPEVGSVIPLYEELMNQCGVAPSTAAPSSPSPEVTQEAVPGVDT